MGTMSGRSANGIVGCMDIGLTLRSYTVEPLHEPVPRPGANPALTPEPELDPAFDRMLMYEDPGFAGMIAPWWGLRAGR